MAETEEELKNLLTIKLVIIVFIEKLVRVMIVNQTLFQKDAMQISIMIKAWLWSGVLEQNFNIFQE